MSIFVTAKNGERINLSHIKYGKWRGNDWVGTLTDDRLIVFDDDPTYRGGYGISDRRKAVLFCDDGDEVFEMRLTLVGWHITDREFVQPIFADGSTYEGTSNHLLMVIELEGEWFSPEDMQYFDSFQAAQKAAASRLKKPE